MPLTALRGFSVTLILSIGAACASGGGSKKSAAEAGAAPALGALSAWSGLPESEDLTRYRATIGTRGMVVSDDREASEWGAETLRRGGNAIDAAVATAFMLAVTRPHFASLGGGGFIVYCPRPDAAGAPRPCHSIDYREQAPAAATRDMYVRNGKASTDLSQDGALASGVPGVPAGLLLALRKFGTLPRQKLLSRPIATARGGSLITGHMEGAALDRWSAMNDEARRLLGCAGKPCPPGTTLKQPDLARVLEEISKRGHDGFYKGWVSKKLAAGLRKAGGIITEADLASYEPREREPVAARFHDFEVVSMGPPSSGGAIVLQLLRYAELAAREGQFADGPGSARALHAMAHGMSLGFADRAEYFGDPDHVKLPLAGLLDPAYLERRWRGTWNADRAQIPPGAGPVENKKEPTLTTHFSVMDREGNAVALTTTVNDNFGSGFVPPGTGVVMNNQMDDFAIQPGVPNLFGLVGGEANAVAPRKRPLSSMSPTVVRDLDGWPRVVIGAQGGPRIITGVYQALLNRLQFGMAIPDAVIAPRIHHQWKPARVNLEVGGFSSEARSTLTKLGYELREGLGSGKLHALERFRNGRVWGMSDPRAEGAAVPE